jgi:hypothetical protein
LTCSKKTCNFSKTKNGKISFVFFTNSFFLFIKSDWLWNAMKNQSRDKRFQQCSWIKTTFSKKVFRWKLFFVLTFLKEFCIKLLKDVWKMFWNFIILLCLLCAHFVFTLLFFHFTTFARQFPENLSSDDRADSNDSSQFSRKSWKTISNFR